LLKKNFIILFATSFSGLFLNNFAEATVLNNSYKEVIYHVWQIVYRDFLDSSGKFQKSNWINLRKEVLSKTYSDSNEAYDAIRDMLSNLDDSYTRFLEPKEFNQMRIDTSGELTGVGIQIVKDKESDDLIIISPIEGTPAFDAGIKARDKILSIDDMSTEGMNIEEAVKLIRGQRGTKVKLEILRGSNSFFKILSKKPETLSIKGLSSFLSVSSKLNVKVVNKDVVLFKSIDKEKNYSESGIITRKTGELIHEITKNMKSENSEKYISIYSCNKNDKKV